MKHCPLLLGLVLLLGALAAYALRTSPAPDPHSSAGMAIPPGSKNPGSPAVKHLPPPSGAQALPDPEIRNPAFGKLRILLLAGPEPVSGHILILGSDDRSEASVQIDGPGRMEFVQERLTPGAKRIVVLPEHSYLSASVPAEVVPDQTGDVTLHLKEAAVLEGTVLDSLQRPFPGVTVEARLTSVFTPGPLRREPVDLWGQSGGRSGGSSAGNRRTPVHHSRSLLSNGVLKTSVTTNDEGAFELHGMTDTAVALEVSYKNVRFTWSCSVNGDNRIIVPALPEPAARNLNAEQVQQSVLAIMRQMAVHHENPEPYAAQLREILHRTVNEAAFSPKEREELRKNIDAIGRPEPKREPR